MIVAATGHRPDKLGGYGDDVLARLVRGARRYLVKVRGSQAISGLAIGWDTAFALAALEEGIPLVAAVPFEGQDSRWPDASKAMYRHILAEADEVVIVSPGGFSNNKFQRRNVWMVDRAKRMAALWDGSSGGTANCIAYAEAVTRPVDNLWPQYRQFI